MCFKEKNARKKRERPYESEERKKQKKKGIRKRLEKD